MRSSKTDFFPPIKRLIAVVLALVVTFGLFLTLDESAFAAEDGMIRVKLTYLGIPSTLKFTTTCAYAINNAASDLIPPNTAVTVTKSGEKLTLAYGSNKRTMGAAFELNRAATGVHGVRFTSPKKDNLFMGDLMLSTSGSGIQTVLRIYIEDYLYGVVAYEMSNSFPLEALKAQAVAARTYAMMNKKSTGSYDLLDTPASQVFKGYNAANKNVIRAVDETKGICLTYNGKYAQCYYTASNGGQTELTNNVWGGTTSYIKMKDDPYDIENPSSTVKSHEIVRKPTSSKPLHSGLRTALIVGMKSELEKQGRLTDTASVSIDEITKIEGVSPRYNAPSRTYTALRFTMKVSSPEKGKSAPKALQAPITVDLKTYGDLETKLSLGINSANNEIISVDSHADKFVLNFRRYGHGIGMSQRGAQWMAKQYGKKYTDILTFYFDGTNIVKKDLADKTGSFTGAQTAVATPTPTPKPNAYVDLKPGSSGEAVKNIQRRLKELKYFTGDVAGNYLSKTTSAVKAFQKANGLKVDGVATAETQRVLFSKDAVPSATATPKPTNTPKPTTAPAAYATVQLDKKTTALTVRKTASTKAKGLTKLKQKTRVTVLSTKKEWARVKVGKNTGYVLGYYLVYETTDELVCAAPTAAPTLAAGKTATVSLSKTSSKLTIYKKASKSSKKLGKLSHNTKVTVTQLKSSSKFAKISANGKVGYVEKKYLKP